jgi:hypothetical protein
MKKYIYLIFTISFILNSCNNENNILIPIDSDNELQKQIEGTWTSQYNTHTTVYYSNATFVDSMFSAVDSIRYDLYFVAEGDYTIKDSILIKSNITVKFIDSSHFFNIGFYYLFSSKYLKFSNNSLTEFAVDVFEPLSEGNNGIWGGWSRITWTYNLSFSEPTYLGRIKSIWIFDDSTQKITSWNEYLDRTYNTISDTSYTVGIVYNPPILDLNGFGDDLIEVKFTQKKMFWWYSYKPHKFYRNN